MINDKLILIAKKHQIWVDIVCTFGCTREVAEDLTQEMYIKIQIKLKNGLDIMYKEEINYYYIFKTLKSLFIDLKRKGKNIKIYSFDEVTSPYLRNKIYEHQTVSEDVDFEGTYNAVLKDLSKMDWYDRRVFEIINDGESVADFSRQTKIPYYTLYFTFKKVKNKLKKLI